MAKFGSRRKQKTGGKTNAEKKKNNPYLMTQKKRGVQIKAMNRESDGRKKRRSQKKMFRGKQKR